MNNNFYFLLNKDVPENISYPEISTLLVNNKGILILNSQSFGPTYIKHIEIYANADGFVQILVKKLLNKRQHRSTNHSVHQLKSQESSSSNQPIRQSISQPLHSAIKETNQSVNHPANQSVNQSVNEPVNESNNQSINNQSTNT